MSKSENRLEAVWKTRGFSIGLVYTALALAIWAAFWPQSPGVSIGLLAGVAGVMSLRTEMHIYEKVSWVVILIFFVVLEVLAIGRNQKHDLDERDRQNAAFQVIVDGLKASAQASRDQYTNTIGHVDNVLGQSKEISSLTKKSLLNITGGDAYAYITPQTVENSHSYAMSLQNPGDQTLTGISVTISKITVEECTPQENEKFCSIQTDDGVMHPISIPSLAAHLFFEMPNLITTNPDGSGHFAVLISAQNGTASEQIWFRKSRNGNSSAYRLEVSTGTLSKHRLRKKIDWTEPVKRPAGL